MLQSGWSRRGVLKAMAAGAACAVAGPVLSRPSSLQGGLLLRDVRLVDGVDPARATDVLVRGDTIEHIGRVTDGEARGLRVIDGGGRVLAPGFIDLHTHGNPLEESFAPFLAMGVTTVLLGQDGSSPSLPEREAMPGSLGEWIGAVGHATPDINVATLSGHGALRRRAGIDDGTRRPSGTQLERMRAILGHDLAVGAFGLSTGLEYVPGLYAERRELASLGPVVADADGVVMSHMRSEDADEVRDSIRELVNAAGKAHAHVSHLKMVYGKGEAAAEELLAFMQGQRSRRQPLTADTYPYEASYTGVAILFPEWALPPNDYAAVLESRSDELRAHLQQRMEQRGGPAALLFGTGPYAGRTLAQVAVQRDLRFAELLLEIGPGGGKAAHFVMDRALQDRLLLDPHVAIASDGSPGGSHPRGAGTFARLIEAYVASTSRLSLEEAVWKATVLPASVLRLWDRGTVRTGNRADLVLFDPGKVRARADYVDPTALAEGFDLVVVNGQPAYEAGEPVARAGRMLRSGSQPVAGFPRQ